MGLRGVEVEIQRLDHAKTKADLGKRYIYITNKLLIGNPYRFVFMDVKSRKRLGSSSTQQSFFSMEHPAK